MHLYMFVCLRTAAHVRFRWVSTRRWHHRFRSSLTDSMTKRPGMLMISMRVLLLPVGSCTHTHELKCSLNRSNPQCMMVCLSGVLLGPHQSAAARPGDGHTGPEPPGVCLWPAGAPCLSAMSIDSCLDAVRRMKWQSRAHACQFNVWAIACLHSGIP